MYQSIWSCDRCGVEIDGYISTLEIGAFRKQHLCRKCGEYLRLCIVNYREFNPTPHPKRKWYQLWV